VLGSDDYTGRLKFHVDHVREQKPIFFPALEALISFVSSADAAKSLEFIGKNKITGPVNCCAPEPMRLAEFIKTIEDATGKRAILEKDGEHSPYGISEDWYMSVEKLRKSGLSLDPVANWLRQMI